MKVRNNNSKKKIKTKTKLFKKWLLTYLSLSIVSLVFIYGIHTIYDKSMREDLSQVNSVYLLQMANLFDDQFRAVEQMVYTICLDSDLVKISSFEGELTKYERYEVYEMTQKLDLFARSNSLVEKISIYKKTPQLVIGESGAYYDKYIDIYSKYAYGINSAIFKDLMDKKYQRRITRLDDWYPINSVTNYLLYIESIPIQFPNNPSGALIVKINEENLGNFGKKELLPDGKLLVFNKEKQLIYSNDETLYKIKLMPEDIVNDAKKEVSIEHIEYIKASIQTDYRDWTYVSLVPKEIYFVRINEVRMIIYVMTLIFFLINLLIAYFFTYRMYLPVNKLITTIGENDALVSQSEYEFIESVVVRTAKEKEKMKQDLFMQKKPLLNAFFSKWLRGSIQDEIYINDQLEEFDINFNDEGYQVLLIEFTADNDGDGSFTFNQFIIHNIFEELMTQYYECLIVEVEARIAIILKMKRNSLPTKNLEDYINNAINMVKQRFELSCLIGLSYIHLNPLDMSNAYQESLEALVQASMSEEIMLVYAQDLSGISTQYEFSTEQEYRLMNFIQVGQFEDVFKTIQHIIQDNIKRKHIKASYMQCLMFDLMGAIIKSVNDDVFNEMIEEKDAIHQMMKATNMDEMNKLIVEVASIACEINASNKLHNSKTSIKDDIDKYIEEHFSDVELNVSHLGDVFNMTPTYLSKLYKKESNISILHAINSVRVEASKKLLLDTDLTINEVAKEVGYLYSNAFIRFFKKQTGITPGQYKQLHQND